MHVNCIDSMDSDLVGVLQSLHKRVSRLEAFPDFDKPRLEAFPDFDEPVDLHDGPVFPTAIETHQTDELHAYCQAKLKKVNKCIHGTLAWTDDLRTASGSIRRCVAQLTDHTSNNPYLHIYVDFDPSMGDYAHVERYRVRQGESMHIARHFEFVDKTKVKTFNDLVNYLA